MYAIMICLDGENDWIFVTEDTSNDFILQPMLFDDMHEAMAYSENWIIPGKEENVSVVKFENYKDTK